MAFGLFIPLLGFYWDDWPLILTGKFQGAAGYWPYWQFDRPFAAWTYAASYLLLGDNPLYWQVTGLLLCWGTAAVMWWTLIRVWPSRKQVLTWAALLFSIYPVFNQQAISVTYNQHWICFFLYFLSTGLMVEAVNRPRWRLALTGLALAASLFQLFSMEYFVGLEVLRPLFLWPLTNKTKTGKDKAAEVGKWWLPYLLGWAAFLAWRIFFLKLPVEDRNAPTLLADFLGQPLQTIGKLFQMALQDISYILVTTWYKTFQPGLFDLSSSLNAVLLFLGAAGAFLIGLFLRAQANENPEETLPDAKSTILIGLLLVLAAPLPAWITDRQVTVGAYSDRLAIPAMFGAGLLLAGLVAWLVRGKNQQIIIVSLLIGLALCYHMQTANDYRWARILQNRFYWQLFWRAPGITPGTAIFAEAEVLPKTGLYSTAAGINMMYAESGNRDNLPYWFFSLTREFSHRIPDLLGGINLDASFRQFTFQGISQNSLILYYSPEDADCMRFVSAQDSNDPGLPTVTRQALSISDLSRIQSAQEGDSLPASDIFGPEPEHGWCYYFQKADLARQMGEWDEVVSLGDQARAAGFSMANSQSNTPQEWLPLVEGYARGGRWQEALEISRQMLDAEPKMGLRMCDAWQVLLRDVPEIGTHQEVQDLLSSESCRPQ